MTRPDVPRAGYDLDENVARFSNLFHVLRELVHLTAGWLPLVPALEHKVRLGDHLHDDARAVAEVRDRLEELCASGDHPGAPGRELADVLDRAASARAPGDYLTTAYGASSPRCSAPRACSSSGWIR